jgi:hypothetical protein
MTFVFTALLALFAADIATEGVYTSEYKATGKAAIERTIDAKYNAESGQTDFTIAGHEFSLDTEYRYDFNN